MDMESGDIELDDIDSEYNEHLYHIILNSERERLRRDAAASRRSMVNSLSALCNRLFHLRSYSLGNILYWIIFVLGLLVFAGCLFYLVSLTVYTWFHGIMAWKTYFASASAPTTTRLAAYKPLVPLHHTAPASHKNAPLGMLHPDNRLPVFAFPDMHDNSATSNETDHRRSLENCASNLMQRMQGDELEATPDLKFVLYRCQMAVFAALDDLFSPEVVDIPPKSGKWAWKAVGFVVLAPATLLGVRILLRMMRRRLRRC